MSISLTESQYTPAEVAKIAGDLMGEPVTAAEPIGQGANSRVYQLSSSSGKYVMKFYFQHPEDTRDRLGTEFGSLSFLWAQGIRQIPQPLRAWPGQSCALFAWVEGISPARNLTAADIDQTVDFIKRLKILAKVAGAKEFVPASEAFFSTEGLIENLKTRLKRLGGENNAPEYKALREYLENDFNPLLEDIAMWSKEYLNNYGVRWEQELKEQYRTLSPSDFGFHNALRASSGEIVFLDFEYFGWDDPVKLVSDFLWHPAMSLTEPVKQGFINRIQGVFDDERSFQSRLKALFPLFGLKWCLILLNEFVPVDMQRRGFARALTPDKTVIRLNQLAKAQTLSHLIRRNYTEFPYGN